MDSVEWVAAGAAIAIALAKNRSQEEIAFLALLFTQIGDSLALLAETPPEAFR